MRYGLTRKLNFYSLETEAGCEIIATAGDYLKAQLWCDKHLSGIGNQQVVDLYQTVVWAWFALSRNEKLKWFGLPEKLSKEGLEDMASTTTVFMEALEDDALPLASSPKPQGR